MAIPFNGQLKSNEIFAAIYNMIISQQVVSDNIPGLKKQGSLVEQARVDGTLYGDTKIYYFTDALKSVAWGGDSEAANLLQLHRPDAPKTQSITIDTFRMIPLTVDNYLSKRAFSTEGAFSEFTGVMLGWMRDTKKIYDTTLFNTFVGTNKGTGAAQNITVTLSTDTVGGVEATNRLNGQEIAETVANTIVAMEDIGRDFNDLGLLRAYDADDFNFVWNAEYANKITKLDLPTIFHKDGLVDKLSQYTLPARYFGAVNTAAGTAAASNSTVRSLYETDYTVGSTTTHVFPGDLVPNSAEYDANETYTVDPKVICKIYHKNGVPFMSGFETGTEFFNPRSLTETHYLIWGHNGLEALADKPFITIEEA